MGWLGFMTGTPPTQRCMDCRTLRGRKAGGFGRKWIGCRRGSGGSDEEGDDMRAVVFFAGMVASTGWAA